MDKLYDQESKYPIIPKTTKQRNDFFRSHFRNIPHFFYLVKILDGNLKFSPDVINFISLYFVTIQPCRSESINQTMIYRFSDPTYFSGETFLSLNKYQKSTAESRLKSWIEICNVNSQKNIVSRLFKINYFLTWIHTSSPRNVYQVVRAYQGKIFIKIFRIKY